MIDRSKGAGVSIPTRSTLWDSSWPKLVDDQHRARVLGYLEDRFGISRSAFDGFILLERPQSYWLLTRSPHVEKLARLGVHTTGIPLLRKKKGHLKPTTTAIQAFGARGTKNVVHLNREQLTDLLTGNGLSLPLSVSSGYVILAHERHVLGCGLYTRGRLVSQIPRSYLPHR
jgi:NOL1/NOP2/fmu family ribosome biogenesis protein